MNKQKILILLLLLTFFSFGCQSKPRSAETTVPVTEAALETETVSVTTSSETEATEPGIEQYQAFQWMIDLTAEEVAFVEFINLSDPDFPYRRYEGTQIQEVIDLFQAKDYLEYMPMHPLFEYEPIVQWPGYYSKEFHVVMLDGTVHTVCSVFSTITVIDGTGFRTISDWLNNHWPESGNTSLPENWQQQAAARSYHISDDRTSTLSTQFQEDQRFHLDQSYDTKIEFGSRSRNYPIGRGGVELSASAASKAGISLNAFWASTGSPSRICVQPQYWLEQWNEDTGCYVAFDNGRFRSEVPQLLPEATRSWYVSWEDTCALLKPGHYRVGMTFYEEYNGSVQNETICYAKFSIE